MGTRPARRRRRRARPTRPGKPGPAGRFGFPSIGGIFGFGGGLPSLGVSPFGGVTIASINGDTIGLKTADGWTRTITLGSSVKITEAGRTMSAGDLKVGQSVRLQEKRNSDGTFTVTGLAIVTPSVVGQVTAKTATTITIKRFDGTTQVIDVDSSTTFHIQGAATSNLAADHGRHDDRRQRAAGDRRPAPCLHRPGRHVPAPQPAVRRPAPEGVRGTQPSATPQGSGTNS